MNNSAQPQGLSWRAMTAPPPAGTASTAQIGSAVADPAPAPAPVAPSANMWDSWRAGFRIADGVVGAIKDLVESKKIPIPDKLYSPLDAGLYGLNAALVDVDTAFYNYMKSGDASAFTLDPPPIVPWPDPSKPSDHILNYFKDALDVLAGALQLEYQKIEADLTAHPELQIVLDALTVLINSEQDILAAIGAVLDPSPVAPAPSAP